jgi:hypothetical protein
VTALGDLALGATVRLLAQPSTVPDEAVTPGVWGFVAIAFVAIATVLIIVDMTRRVRRTRYRGEVRERIEAERAEASQAAAGLDEEARPGQGDDEPYREGGPRA